MALMTSLSDVARSMIVGRRMSRSVTADDTGLPGAGGPPAGGAGGPPTSERGPCRHLARRMSSMQIFAGGLETERRSSLQWDSEEDTSANLKPADEGRLRRLGRLAMLSGRQRTPHPPPRRRMSVRLRLNVLRSLADSLRAAKHGGEGSRRSGNMTTARLPTRRVRDSRFNQYGQAKTLFRLHARRVFMLVQWMSAFNRPNQKRKEMQTFIDMANELDEVTVMKHREEASGIAFNPKDYKAKREIIIPNEIKKMLGLMSEFRTPEMVQRIVACLQAQPSFSEYPLHMQEKLGKVAWYEEVAEKRLILREGHHAENFYFILAGQAIVKKFVRDSNGKLTMNVMGRLGRGQGFGELALLYRKQRSASVESATNMTLLVIRREDFMEIFVRTADGKEPEHITFLRGIKFLEHWPVNSLLDNSEMGLFHYFRRGDVIVADSRKGDLIYVVMSGTCRVLKRLNAVTPSRPGSTTANELHYERLICPSQPTKIDCGGRPKTAELPGPARAIIRDFLAIQHQCSFNDPGASESELESAHAAEEAVAFVAQGHSTPVPLAPGHSTPAPLAQGHSKPASAGQKRVGLRTSLPAMKSAGEGRARQAAGSRGQGNTSRSLTLGLPSARDEMVPSQAPPVREQGEGKPCFVQLRTLRVRDVFGLEEVQFDEERNFDSRLTAVTLVSNGAELVMLKREFFEKLANEKVKQYIREKVWPLPADDTLQENLQCKVNWNAYRHQLVRSVVGRQSNVRRHVHHPAIV